LNRIDTDLITDMSDLFTSDEPEFGINGYGLEKFNRNISNFNGDIDLWPLKKRNSLENINVSSKYNKLPDKIIFIETIVNIFICLIENSDNTFNTENLLFK